MRKVLLTVNNPIDKGLSHEAIKARISNLSSTVYYCISDEIGAEGTPHTHVFLAFRSPVRWSTISKQFPGVHLDPVIGTATQARDYVAKTGKWETSEKKETSVEGTFEEYGTLPEEQQGRRSDLDFLYQQIKEGASDYDILESNPKYLRHINLFDKARQAVAKENVVQGFRHLKVIYLFGETGVGKTRYVFETHGYRNVYRVCDYKNGFDNYSNEAVLFLDEYNSNFDLRTLLTYCDGYVLQLPCRYANKWAAYDTVYIVSNSPLPDQYRDEQTNSPPVWRALLRRITEIVEFLPNGEKAYYKVDDDFNIVPAVIDLTTPSFPGLINFTETGNTSNTSEVVAHKDNS